MNKPTKTAKTICHRCFGAGIFHTHGVCFRCNGSGFDPKDKAWEFPADYTFEMKMAFFAKLEERNAKARARRDAKKSVTEVVEVVEVVEVIAEETRTPAPAGRVTVVGKIVNILWTESSWGGSLKMIVESVEGYEVWSTMPSSLEAEVGDTIEFTAELTPSDRNAFFAFAKRPSKARQLEGSN